MEMELTLLFKSFYWHLQVQALHNKKKIYSTSSEENNKIRTKEMKQSSQCNI